MKKWYCAAMGCALLVFASTAYALNGTPVPAPDAGSAATALGVLTTRFEATDQRWVPLLSEAPVLLRAALAFSAAFVLVVSPRLKTIVRTLAQAVARHRWWPWLSLQLAATGVFWLCTARLFEGGGESILWVAGWVVAAVAVPVLWLLTLAPARCWWTLARQEQRALVVAAVAGGAAAASVRATQALWTPLGAA